MPIPKFESQEFKPNKIKTNLGGGSGSNLQNQLTMLMARQVLSEQQRQRQPQLAAETEQAKIKAKQKAPREILLGNIERLKNLADAVPAGKPGIDRFVTGAKSSIDSFFQQLPQLNTFNRFKDVILGSLVQTIGGETGSRLSDQDINRMRNAFPSLPFDSDVQRALQWDIFFDTVNDVAQKSGAAPIPKEKFLNENDLRLLQSVPGSTQFQDNQSSVEDQIFERLKGSF